MRCNRCATKTNNHGQDDNCDDHGKEVGNLVEAEKENDEEEQKKKSDEERERERKGVGQVGWCTRRRMVGLGFVGSGSRESVVQRGWKR